MTRYKSVIVSKYTKRGMMKAIDQTITDHGYRGYEFVQMCGDPIESIMLLFKIDGDEKTPPTRKELKQMEKEKKARAKQKGKKLEEDQQRELKTNEPQKIESNPLKTEVPPVIVAPVLTKVEEPIVTKAEEPKVTVETVATPTLEAATESTAETNTLPNSEETPKETPAEPIVTVKEEAVKKPKRLPPTRTKKTP